MRLNRNKKSGLEQATSIVVGALSAFREAHASLERANSLLDEDVVATQAAIVSQSQHLADCQLAKSVNHKTLDALGVLLGA